VDDPPDGRAGLLGRLAAAVRPGAQRHRPDLRHHDLFESCEFADASGEDSFPATGDASFGGSTGAPGRGHGDTGPDILLEETVGAFDVVVLTDTELAPIQIWLEDNGYNWDPNAGPILEQYLAEGNVIAALKLTNGAGLEDVHPITLRYDGPRPASRCA
jgi:hypothetical protein